MNDIIKIVLVVALGISIGMIGFLLVENDGLENLNNQYFRDYKHLDYWSNYNSKMQFGVLNELAIRGISLDPVQQELGSQSDLRIIVENDLDEPKSFTVRVTPYNTDDALLVYSQIDSERDSLVNYHYHESLLPQQVEVIPFDVVVMDDAGIYFTTWLEIELLDENEELIESYQVMYVVTTDHEKSTEELFWFVGEYLH